MVSSRDKAVCVTLAAFVGLCFSGTEAFVPSPLPPLSSAGLEAYSASVGNGRPLGAFERHRGSVSVTTTSTTTGRGLETVSDDDIPEMAEFFVSNFWEEDVVPSQKRPLVKELVTDYRRRYGKLVGRRKLPSSLIAARNGKGEIVGCIAVEVSVCQGELVGTKARGLSQNAVDVELRPILANLAVGRSARRKGLAKRLVKQCEDEVKAWGYDEVLLLVEENNQRAKRLYQKLGYKMLFRDREAKRIVPDSYQIRDVPCVNVCMRRDLNANIFSNLMRMIRV